MCDFASSMLTVLVPSPLEILVSLVFGTGVHACQAGIGAKVLVKLASCGDT